eukprot:NODE_99_length_20944_cov_0.552746.p8 type:complete len:123 gc:universal NODE_99_length_20944_cov_0.552746:15896-15528(-)
MVVAWPITSQALIIRTKLLSFIILLPAYASASVTANGRPSGTATTMIVIVSVNISINSIPTSVGSLNLSPKAWVIKSFISRAKKRIIPAATPSLAIISVNFNSFSSRGVGLSSTIKPTIILP